MVSADGGDRGVSKSSVSRQIIEASEAEVEGLLSRRFEDLTGHHLHRRYGLRRSRHDQRSSRGYRRQETCACDPRRRRGNATVVKDLIHCDSGFGDQFDERQKDLPVGFSKLLGAGSGGLLVAIDDVIRFLHGDGILSKDGFGESILFEPARHRRSSFNYGRDTLWSFRTDPSSFNRSVFPYVPHSPKWENFLGL